MGAKMKPVGRLLGGVTTSNWEIKLRWYLERWSKVMEERRRGKEEGF